MPDSESDVKSRFEASLDLLQEVLSLSDAQVEELQSNPKAKREVDSIKHIYSHINAMFHCRMLDLPGDKSPPRIRSEWKSRARWVNEGEVDNANISTGHVKVWKSVSDNENGLRKSKNGKSGAPSGKRKVTENKKEEKGQMKLSFTKSVSVSSKTTKNMKDGVIGEEVEVVEAIIEERSMKTENRAAAVVHDTATASSPRKKRRIDISSDEEE